MASEISPATVRIRAPGAIRAKDREAIANWLRSTADKLELLGGEYVDTGWFTARYCVPVQVPKPSRGILRAS